MWFSWRHPSLGTHFAVEQSCFLAVITKHFRRAELKRNTKQTYKKIQSHTIPLNLTVS